MNRLSPTVWICAACARIGPTRSTVGDEACYLHAVECWRSSVSVNLETGHVFAVTADTDWVEPASFEPRPPRHSRALDAPARLRRLARRAERREWEQKAVGSSRPPEPGDMARKLAASAVYGKFGARK